MSNDFNSLEQLALTLQESLRHEEAIAVYLYMADGDASLDGGHLGYCLAHCYRFLGRLAEAQYWAQRAVEENPSIEVYQRLHAELGKISIQHLVEHSNG